MTIALVMPAREKKAIELGRNLWRKQILRKGSIDYDGRQLDFDDAYVTDLVAAYRDGAFDQVAFQLAGSDGAHTNDPERFRGEIRGVVATREGLDAIIETTDAGSAIIRDNPKLGVSCRIVEGLKHADGRAFKRAIQHVLGTPDPRLTGMGAWQPIALSSPSVDQVIDLSTASYKTKEHKMPDDNKPTFSKDQLAKLAELDPEKLTDDQKTALAALIPDPKGEHAKPETKPGGDKDADKDFDKELEKFLAELDKEPVPAGASTGNSDLSADARQAIELANARAQAAHDEASAVRAQLEVAQFEHEKTDLVRLGVPPAAVELATPFLVGSGHVIDLANGQKADAGVVVRGLLEMMEGTVDLSGETIAAGGAPSSTAERDRLLSAWRTQHPLQGETAPATSSAS